MASQIQISAGSGNSLLPDGTKPSPEPMLTYCKLGPMEETSVSNEIHIFRDLDHIQLISDVIERLQGKLLIIFNVP